MDSASIPTMRGLIQITEAIRLAKVYHVTPKRNVGRIMRDGLQPSIGPRSRKIREKDPAIYVFPDWLSVEDGLSNWLGDEFDETVTLSILELSIPSDWLIRDHLQWEAVIKRPVPPEHIRVVVPDVDDWTGGTPDGVNLASDNDEGGAPLPATPENIGLAKAFVLRKWRERAAERGQAEPADLTGACKFTSLFAARVFGGEVRGNFFHQWVELPNGQTIDLNDEAEDVQAMRQGRIHDTVVPYASAMGQRLPRGGLYTHDQRHMASPDNTESMRSCESRVTAWVEEFKNAVNA